MEQQPDADIRPAAADLLPCGTIRCTRRGLFRNAVLLTGAVFRHRIAGGGSRMPCAVAVICPVSELVFIDLRTLT